MKINQILELIEELLKKSKDENTAEFPNSNLIFRGQSDESWKLLPKLFRNEYTDNLEQDLIDSYKRRYNIFNNNYIDNLTDMQHYGMPTKLLDWSRNILIALFFAVENHNDKNGKLFILDRNTLNQHNYLETYKSLADLLIFPNFSDTDIYSFEEIRKLIDDYGALENNILTEVHDETWLNKTLESLLHNHCHQIRDILEKLTKIQKLNLFRIITKPIILEPQNLNERIVAQSSMFTYLFGENGSCFNIQPFDLSTLINTKIQNVFQDNKLDLNMACILIPADLKRYIKYELETFFNISSSTVYPDDKEKVLAQYVKFNKNYLSPEEKKQLKIPKLFVSSCF